MGIEYQDMRSILRTLKREMPPPFGKLLVLGDAVIHFSPQELQVIAKQEDVELHSLPDILTPRTLGASLGFSQIDTLDVNGKATLTLNLQDPLPDELLEKYDLVIDAGVLFWCFDPGLALKNIFKLSKANGLIFHITALSGYYGRGYYNIHPRLFEDFYISNQCVFVESSIRTKPRLTRWERFEAKVTTLLGISNEKILGVSYYSSSGAIYLGEVHHNYMKFAKKLVAQEPDMIPNNVISTFAFRKTINIEPSEPLQTC